MLFGNVRGPTGGAKPRAVQMNGITGEVRFFLGDHWISIGYAYLVMTAQGPIPQLPDCDQFIRDRRHLDDGSDDWYRFGPTLN